MSNLGSSKIYNNDQGIFSHNKTITNVPLFNLAYINNIHNNTANPFPESIVDLAVTYLTYSDFLSLFFSGYGGAFRINHANSNIKALSLTTQTYSTTHDPIVSYFLKDQIIKAYEKTYNTSILSIPVHTKINLDREMFLAKSLSSLTGTQIGLSLDEAINALIANNEIIKADMDSSARVIFIITLNYIHSDLKVACVANFRFQTDIPGFANNHLLMTLDLPKSYSNALVDNKPEIKQENPNKQFYYEKDDASEVSDFKNEEFIDDEKSLTSSDSNTIISSNSLNTNLVKEVSNIIRSGESVANSTVW
jgi:hypothetical protein